MNRRRFLQVSGIAGLLSGLGRGSAAAEVPSGDEPGKLIQLCYPLGLCRTLPGYESLNFQQAYLGLHTGDRRLISRGVLLLQHVTGRARSYHPFCDFGAHRGDTPRVPFTLHSTNVVKANIPNCHVAYIRYPSFPPDWTYILDDVANHHPDTWVHVKELLVGFGFTPESARMLATEKGKALLEADAQELLAMNG